MNNKFVLGALFFLYFFTINSLNRARLNANDYKAYKSFKYEGPEVITFDNNMIDKVKILHHNTNPMIGYLGIPVRFKSKKEYVKGTYLGQVDSKKTAYPHTYIPED